MDERLRVGRSVLKNITTKSQFNKMMDSLFITPVERSIMESKYLDGKSLGLIADETGYTLQYVQLLHRNILYKISESFVHLHQVQ